MMDRLTDSQLAAHGIEVAHHFGGGVYAKETHIPAGAQIVQHDHPYAHLSVLASGRVVVEVGGTAMEYAAPACLTIAAGRAHSIQALTDAVWYCIHQTDETDAAEVDSAILRRPLIERIAAGLPVAAVREALAAHPRLWDEFPERTADPSSPHYGLSDIWVRFVPKDKPGQACEWYPSADVLGVKDLCLDVMRYVGGAELGGVLITRIPPGGECRPHIDDGWHAEKYEKFAVQIAAHPGQRFQVGIDSLVTQAGDLYRFDNSVTHWVTNPTEHERITMIVCVRRS